MNSPEEIILHHLTKGSSGIWRKLVTDKLISSLTGLKTPEIKRLLTFLEKEGKIYYTRLKGEKSVLEAK